MITGQFLQLWYMAFQSADERRAIGGYNNTIFVQLNTYISASKLVSNVGFNRRNFGRFTEAFTTQQICKGITHTIQYNSTAWKRAMDHAILNIVENNNPNLKKGTK